MGGARREERGERWTKRDWRSEVVQWVAGGGRWEAREGRCEVGGRWEMVAGW